MVVDRVDAHRADLSGQRRRAGRTLLPTGKRIAYFPERHPAGHPRRLFPGGGRTLNTTTRTPPWPDGAPGEQLYAICPMSYDRATLAAYIERRAITNCKGPQTVDGSQASNKPAGDWRPNEWGRVLPGRNRRCESKPAPQRQRKVRLEWAGADSVIDVPRGSRQTGPRRTEKIFMSLIIIELARRRTRPVRRLSGPSPAVLVAVAPWRPQAQLVPESESRSWPSTGSRRGVRWGNCEPHDSIFTTLTPGATASRSNARSVGGTNCMS